jgi:hypothetical protein
MKKKGDTTKKQNTKQKAWNYIIPVCYLQIKLGAVYRHGIVDIFSNLIPILKGK